MVRCLAVWACVGIMANGSYAGTGLFASCPVPTDSLDFVHSESVFDPCYAAFLKIYDAWKFDYERENVRTSGGKFIDDEITRYGHRECDDSASYAKMRGRMTYLTKAYRKLHERPGLDLGQEKEKLVEQLESFRDTALVLPSIYVEIESQYGGDVRKYVEALFENSVMTNEMQLKRLVETPSVRKMQRDMGFQFVVSKLMYRAWETRGQTEDFVHGRSIFDACYPEFLKIQEALAFDYEGKKVEVHSAIPGGIRRYLYHYRPKNYESNYDKMKYKAQGLKTAYDRLHGRPWFDVKAEKKKLVRQLETYRDTATVGPTIYAEIDEEYDGDVRRYVDALFDNSVMTNGRRMERFVKVPTVLRMRRDMGLQFVESKLRFLEWEEQGRPRTGDWRKNEQPWYDLTLLK